MDQLQELLEIEQIKHLKARYCTCVAKEDWPTFMSLFSEDLAFMTPDGTIYQPRSAFEKMHIRTLQEPKVWGVVHCYTPIIEITGENSAKGVWGMEDIHVWPGDGPRIGHHGYGHYHEDYVRTTDGWKFKRIDVIYDRMDPLEGGFGGITFDTFQE